MSAIVIASTPRSASSRTAPRTPSSSSGSTSSAAAEMRPPTSRTSRVSASGGGFSQIIQPLTGPGVHERAISRM